MLTSRSTNTAISLIWTSSQRGEIVPQLSATFDAFWNSRYAYPIASVASAEQPESTLAPLVETNISANAKWLAHELDGGVLNLLWVPATVLADKPAKLAEDADAEDNSTTVANNIGALMRSAKQELLIISPYFCAGQRGHAAVAGSGRSGCAYPGPDQLACLDRFAARVYRLLALSGRPAEAWRRFA